jgi:hypothetical protein
MKKFIVLIVLCFTLFSCGFWSEDHKLTGIDEVGWVEFHKYKGYKVIDVYKDWSKTDFYVMKNDTVRDIIVPRWFNNLYHIKDTIK